MAASSSGPALGQPCGDRGGLVRDRPVRLDEDEQHVGAVEAPQVGVQRRARIERWRHGARPDRRQHEAGLSHVRRRHRIGEGEVDREPALLASEQHDDGAGHGAEHQPWSAAFHRERQMPERETRQHVGHAHRQHRDSKDARGQPPRRAPREHRGDVPQMLRIPVHVEVASVDAPGGHVEIVARDEHGPDRRQDTLRQWPRASKQHSQDQDAQGELDRQRVPPHDAGCRPHILECQRRVEHDEGKRQHGPGAPAGEGVSRHR